jgi:serine-type D-Ala-D-Ala carboxypeptidase/endopeptidase
MQRYLAVFVASLALSAAIPFVQAADTPAAAAPPPTADIKDAINTRFEHFRETVHAPGLVWGIVQDGKLAYSGTLGVQDIETQQPVTADTVFRIASMSKAFTALAILELADEGKLSLDAPLARYLPQGRKWHYPTGDSPALRVRDLSGHTAGLGPDDPWSDRQQPMDEQSFTALLEKGLAFNQAPEAAYEYSSLGYALLGRVISDVSGQRYDRYIESTLLRPLGMKASGYEIGDVPAAKLAVGYRWQDETLTREPAMGNGAFGAMGGIHTSASDYARWVEFLLSAWPARTGPETGPVRRAVVRELAIGTSFPRLGSRPRAGGAGTCAFAVVYAAGFNTVRDCDLGLVLMHNGGYPGYGSSMLLMPEYGVGIFAFVNRTYAVPVGVVFDAAQALKDAGLLMPRPQPVSEALARAYSLVGAMYSAGDVQPAADDLAVNFLMDRSADDWRKEFGRLKDKVGDCGAKEPIVSNGFRTADFTWHCAQGSLDGTIELSPTDPPLLQSLVLTPAATDKK